MTTLGPAAGHPIIPVVVIDDPARATDLALALRAGGIGCAEVTLRTPGALEAIRAMAGVPGFVVGAGTVLTADDAGRVADAGARFVVSPGLDDAMLDRARTLGLGLLPGVATATEIMRALARGIEVVKFFPADALGGLATIRALAGPFPGTGFVPSGGVSARNAAEYLADSNVPAVSGSWMAARALIAAGDFEEITRLSTEASALGGAR